MAAGLAYDGAGGVFVFRGRPGGLPRRTIALEDADLAVVGERKADGRVARSCHRRAAGRRRRRRRLG